MGPCSWLSSSGQPSLASLPGVLFLSFLWQVVARYILQSFLLPEAFSDPGQKKSIFLLVVLRALDFAPLSYCDAIVTWPWSPLVRRAGAKGHFLCPWYPGAREVPGAPMVHGAGLAWPLHAAHVPVVLAQAIGPPPEARAPWRQACVQQALGTGGVCMTSEGCVRGRA